MANPATPMPHANQTFLARFGATVLSGGIAPISYRPVYLPGAPGPLAAGNLVHWLHPGPQSGTRTCPTPR